MALVNPQIAMSYRPTTEYQPRNALAEAAQIQQIVGGQRQAEIADMQLESLRRERETLGRIQAAIVAKGGPPDLEAAADEMIRSGKPEYLTQGQAIRAALRNQREAEAYRREFGGGATPANAMVAPTAAAAPAPQGELVAAPIAPPTGTVREIAPGGAMGAPMPLAANALAPAAAAPVNAMVAPAAAPDANATRLAALEARYNRIGNNPELASEKALLLKQIEAALQAQGKTATPQIKEIGVATKTNEPVYFDARTDQQFTIGTDPSGKQVRKPYTGGVNRATSTVTATATSSTPTAKSLSAEVGDRARTSLTKAEGAAGIMESANMVREALNTGNVIAGPLAGIRTKFAQVLELAGAGDKEKLVATRTAIQGLATLTLESRAELRGQGQVTVDEQKLLERARSGNVEDMTIAELQQVVNVSQRLANRMWSSHQTLLKTMEGDPAAADTIRYYRPTMPLSQAIGEGKPKAEADERTQRLKKILDSQQQQQQR